MSGSLEKLTIRYEKGARDSYNGRLEVLFNPNKLTISKRVSWSKKKMAGYGQEGNFEEGEFDSIELETLTVELFFNTYTGRQADSVVKHTDQIAALARLDRELHRPPVCILQWGRFELIKGVLTNLEQSFTMFMPNGTPVRATLNCTFTQYRSDQYAAKSLDLHSADVPKTRTIRRQDTLQSIAAEEYGDPAQWRHIAKENRILNPRALKPGKVLAIPAIR